MGPLRTVLYFERFSLPMYIVSVNNRKTLGEIVLYFDKYAHNSADSCKDWYSLTEDFR